ncbi:hypothetical protein [Mangrovicoccus sp. HB161399]|uniref:hypothetical protein n=1 Tax=Mangrovicoccus sp. HB161399 TaxID=2720392 RepID=UPI0015548B97|nr:hypothetical protein [Mangrovicoccus sp. HB161399]
MRAKLVRPLDWRVAADHAGSFGVVQMLDRAAPEIPGTEVGRSTHDFCRAGEICRASEHWGFSAIIGGNGPLDDPELARPVREEIVGCADMLNDSGVLAGFTGDRVRSRIEAKMLCLKPLGECNASLEPGCQTAGRHIRIIRGRAWTNGTGSSSMNRPGVPGTERVG